MSFRRIYFSTRDLLVMAALAALGGVASTYVNAIGDFIQSIPGLAGTTRWAAGLHVVVRRERDRHTDIEGRPTLIRHKRARARTRR